MCYLPTSRANALSALPKTRFCTVVASTVRPERAHLLCAPHVSKELLIYVKFYKLWKLRVESVHVLSVFGGSLSVHPKHTEKMVVCVSFAPWNL